MILKWEIVHFILTQKDYYISGHLHAYLIIQPSCLLHSLYIFWDRSLWKSQKLHCLFNETGLTVCRVVFLAHWQVFVHIQSKCGNGMNILCTYLIKWHMCKCKGGLISSPGAWFIFLWLHSTCTSANPNEHLESGIWSLDVSVVW